MGTMNFTYKVPYCGFGEKKRFGHQWATNQSTLNGNYINTLVFNNFVPKCSHIKMELTVTNVSGSVMNMYWSLMVYRTNYGWISAYQFILPESGEYTLDCDLSNLDISQVALCPSSQLSRSYTWNAHFYVTEMTITETVQVNDLNTGMFQYGVFVNNYGVSKGLTEVYANMGGALSRPTQILVNIGGQLIPLAPVYSAYWKTEADSMNLYKFIPPTDGSYRIKVKLLSGDHEIRLYDSSFEMLYSSFFYDSLFSLTGGSTYYITLTHYYPKTESESYLQIYKEG